MTIYRSGVNQFPSRNERLDVLMERLTLGYFGLLIGTWVISSVTNSRSLVQIAMVNLLLLLLFVPTLLSVLFVLRYSVLNGTVHGVMWAFRISNGIAKEREQGRFELLWLAPSGPLGATMAVCTGCLYRKATLHTFVAQRRYILSAAILIGLLAVLNASYQSPSLYTSPRLLALIDASVLIAGLYIDSVHSTVLGSLVGMLVPNYSRSSVDARLWAPIIFLMLQAITFLLTLLTGLVILPDGYALLGMGGWFTEVSPAPVSLIVFFMSREIMIRVFWQLLAEQLNADPCQWTFWP
jgi:hypothetical protein